jgi:hypothetical protein
VELTATGLDDSRTQLCNPNLSSAILAIMRASRTFDICNHMVTFLATVWLLFDRAQMMRCSGQSLIRPGEKS